MDGAVTEAGGMGDVSLDRATRAWWMSVERGFPSTVISRSTISIVMRYLWTRLSISRGHGVECNWESQSLSAVCSQVEAGGKLVGMAIYIDACLCRHCSWLRQGSVASVRSKIGVAQTEGELQE